MSRDNKELNFIQKLITNETVESSPIPNYLQIFFQAGPFRCGIYKYKIKAAKKDWIPGDTISKISSRRRANKLTIFASENNVLVLLFVGVLVSIG